jgi:hypothetical protein
VDLQLGRDVLLVEGGLKGSGAAGGCWQHCVKDRHDWTKAASIENPQQTKDWHS